MLVAIGMGLGLRLAFGLGGSVLKFRPRLGRILGPKFGQFFRPNFDPVWANFCMKIQTLTVIP